MAFILTRINVGSYEMWKPMFDADGPGTRQTAKGHRVFRNVDDPNEVFLEIEFASVEDAQAGRGSCSHRVCSTASATRRCPRSSRSRRPLLADRRHARSDTASYRN